MVNAGGVKIVLPDNYIGLCCLLLITVMSVPVAAGQVLPDLDGDGVPDAVDADQDNDGLLNAEEGLVQIEHHELPESVQYILMPESMVPDDQGLQAGFAMQTADDVLDLHAEMIMPVVRTHLQQIDSLPKVQLVDAGRAVVEWTIRRGNNAVPMNIDFLLSDLDAERIESVLVEQFSIVGYTLSSDSSIEVQNLPENKLLFIAAGDAAHGPGSVLLHVRNQDALRIEYHNSTPQSSGTGARAGFLHSFDSAFAGTYTMVTGEKDTDVDGEPDHRDIDSDGDDVPDVVEAGFVKNIEEAIEAPVDEQGVPRFEIDNESTADVASVTTDQDGDGLEDHQEWYLGTDKTIFDTDADGFGDGEEVSVYHTDPTDAASSPMVPTETSDEPNNSIVEVVADDVPDTGAAMQNDATSDARGDSSPLATGVKGVGCVMSYGGRDSALLLILVLVLLSGWVGSRKRVRC